METPTTVTPKAQTQQVPAEQHVDPVCGMTVEPESAAAEHVHEGKKYYFCAVRCKKRFQADPHKFSASGQHPAGPVAKGARVHLPDAPGSRKRQTGLLPQVRRGSRANDADH